MIRRAFVPHEMPFLIEVVLLNKDEVNRLPEADAQKLIDVIDEARSILPTVMARLLILARPID